MRTVFVILFLCLLCPQMLSAAGHDQLGVQTHYGHKTWEPISTLDAIQALGVGWIRDDLLWKSVEKEKGKLEIPDFAWEWIKAAKARDLKIVLTLHGANEDVYEDPHDMQAYANFARFAATQLKGYVDVLELINEPFNHFRRKMPGSTEDNSHWNGWNPQTGAVDPWVIKYSQTMNAMAQAIHEAAPNQYKIIGLGCSPPVNARLLKVGVSPLVDGLVLHPYSHRMVPELLAWGSQPSFLERDGITVGDSQGTFASVMKDMMKLSAQFNGPKELWLTEQGYTTYIPADKPKAKYAGFTESAQAKYAQRRFMECLGMGIRFASWYNFYNKGDHPHQVQDHFGLMRRDGSLKPSYFAIQNVARTMLNWADEPWGDVKIYFNVGRPDTWPVVWDGATLASSGEARAYTFANEKQRAVAIWSTERADGDLQSRAADVLITSDRLVTGITAMDMLTGEQSKVSFEQVGQLVKIEKLMLLDHPTFLILQIGEPAVAKSQNHSDHFAKAEAWQFHSPKNIDAKWRMEKNNEQSVGILDFNLPSDSSRGYVGANLKQVITAQTPVIRLQYKVTIDCAILLRFSDSTGQTHQYKTGLTTSSRWQNHQVKLTDSAKSSWGGARDGKMHFPISDLFIGVERSKGEPLEGQLQLRDLQITAE